VSVSDLAGADVAILGAGREGQAAWRYLRGLYPDKRLTLYAEAEVDPDFAASLDPALDRVRVGPLWRFDLASHQLLVRSPGISRYRPELQAAAHAGARFTSASSLWFAANPAARTICITGTKGKSTTTALTAHLLQAAGCEVVMAGNIGRPMLDFGDARPDWWVIELSSYQLCDLRAQPSVGALLNLSDEHLDWHGDAARYRADKLRLAALLGGRPLVANRADPNLREALAGYRDLRWFESGAGWHVSEGSVVRGGEGAGYTLPRLPGRHNLRNLAAALTLLETVGHLPERLQDSLAAFAGLPHRLHSLGWRGGLEFVDDSLATTPVASLAALEAFAGRAVCLLVGGLDRGLDWGALATRFRAAAPFAIIGMPDSGPHVVGKLAAAGVRPEGGLHEAPELAAAVARAVDITPAGGVVLLSPGAPSFPRFRDYAERGMAFARAAGFVAQE